MLAFFRIVSHARDEGVCYRGCMRTFSQLSGPAHRTTPLKACRETNSITSGISLRKNSRMVPLLEPPSTKASEEDDRYHMEQHSPKVSHVEGQQDEIVEHLLAFDSPLRPRSRSPGGRIKQPRIAGSSSSANLNRPGWEARKPLPILYDFDHLGHYSTHCRTSIAHFEEIIANYETLSAGNKARVHDNNYVLTCQFTRPNSAMRPCT